MVSIALKESFIDECLVKAAGFEKEKTQLVWNIENQIGNWVKQEAQIMEIQCRINKYMEMALRMDETIRS